ncbi:MAG: hypothetical protein H7124_08915 [Phycisphaerales bacterium]|nr:hypothetical protein [Hyphomonadaceae bacterium]
MIWAVGELALHVFVPLSPDEPLALQGHSHVQLGGGAGMIARAAAASGKPAGLIGVVGGDATGDLIAQLASSSAASSLVARDTENGSSVVYLHASREKLERVTFAPGGPRMALCLESLDHIKAGAPVYCPAFPGYDEVLRALAARDVQLIVDIGFAPWLGDTARLQRATEDAPDCACMMISCAGLSPEEIQALAERAARKTSRVLATAGARAALIRDREELFWRQPPPAKVVRCDVGAGDIVAHTLLQALDDGTPFVSACERALSAASAHVGRWGVEVRS